MKTRVVVPGHQRAARNLDHVAASTVIDRSSPLELDSQRLDRRSQRELDDFKHTPQPLLESWIAYRKLMGATNAGDTVLLSDFRGLGGLFALYQWSLPPDQRRVVITVAADSAFLHWQWIAGTSDGIPMPLASQIDWEITQYRWSDRVISLSEAATSLLRQVEVEAEAAVHHPENSSALGDIDVLWAPEPVGRRSRTGDILRAVSSLDGVLLNLSEDDEEDEVWTGTTWDAVRHARGVVGDRVSRGVAPSEPSALVLGDPFSVPDREVVAAVAQGLPVVVPAGSAASARWSDAPTWTDSDELVDALYGLGSPREIPTETAPAGHARVQNPGRARRISVGIPVFRDVRFLDECLDSLLSQDLEPIEIVIVDDGSRSDEVDAALETAKARDNRTLILRGEHRGVCVARNLALEQMTGDAFLFLDADDVLEPGFLARCAELIRSDESVMAVATWTRFFGAYEGIEAKPPFDSRVGMRENPIISTAALVDMRVREMGVRFAPDLAFIYCEDWHFWSQITAAGGRFGLVPEPLIRHRVHDTSGGFMRTDLAYAVGRSRATEPLRQ